MRSLVFRNLEVRIIHALSQFLAKKNSNLRPKRRASQPASPRDSLPNARREKWEKSPPSARASLCLLVYRWSAAASASSLEAEGRDQARLATGRRICQTGLDWPTGTPPPERQGFAAQHPAPSTGAEGSRPRPGSCRAAPRVGPVINGRPASSSSSQSPASPSP